MRHNITILPQAGLPGQPDDTVSTAGSVVTVNSEAFDLSGIPDGGEGVPSGDHAFVGAITRTGSDLFYSLRVRYSTATAVPFQTRTDWTVVLEDEALADLVERKA